MSILYNMKKLKSRLQNRGWVSSDILPTESGDYLCLTDSKYKTMGVLGYSERHKAFNASDYSETCKHKISVEYWQPLPKAPTKKTDWKTMLKMVFLFLAEVVLLIIGAGAAFAALMMITLQIATHFPEWVAWAWVCFELVGGFALLFWKMKKDWKGAEYDSE